MADQKMTSAIRRWLERLAADGPQSRGPHEGGSAARAIRAGWTDWLMIYKPTGEHVLWRQHSAQGGATLFDYEHVSGRLEAITPAGRAALTEDKREGGE